MPDLDQVINLRAASNSGFPYAGAIDAGVCLYFHFIFDDGWTRLDDFVPFAIIVLREAKSIRADHSAILQDHTVSQDAVLAHDSMSMSKEVVANASARINDNMRKQRSMIPYLNIVFNNGVGADRRIPPDSCGRVTHSCLVDSGHVLVLWMKQFDRTRECQIGVFVAE